MKPLVEYFKTSFSRIDITESFASEQIRLAVTSLNKNNNVSSIGLAFDKITDEDFVFNKNSVDFNSSNIVKLAKNDNATRLWLFKASIIGVTSGTELIWFNKAYEVYSNKGWKPAFKTVKGAADQGYDCIVLSKDFSTASLQNERFLSKQDALAFKKNSDILKDNTKRLNQAAAELRLSKFVESDGGKDMLLQSEKIFDEATTIMQNLSKLQDWEAVSRVARALRDLTYALTNAADYYRNYSKIESQDISKVDIKTLSNFSKNSIMSYINSAKEDLKIIQSYNNLA
jgi:hypothetical protein